MISATQTRKDWSTTRREEPKRTPPDAGRAIQKAAIKRRVPTIPEPAGANDIGHANAERLFSTATVRPNADATAAILAANSVRPRTGKGASTSTSRRSRNVESQLNTANIPTTSMVISTIRCSTDQAEAATSSGRLGEPAYTAAPQVKITLTNNSSDANCPNSWLASPRADAASSSTSIRRKRNWR